MGFKDEAHFCLALVLVIGCFFSCSVGGKDVVSDESFDDRVELARLSKLLQCAPYADTHPETTDAALPNLGAAFLTAFDWLSPVRHYTRKDLDYCLTAIYATPCYATEAEQSVAIFSARLLFCSPQSASFWDHQHLGQGDPWTVRIQ